MKPCPPVRVENSEIKVSALDETMAGFGNMLSLGSSGYFPLLLACGDTLSPHPW